MKSNDAIGQRCGLTPDRRAIWAYAPGHVWAGWQLAEAEAARRKLKLADRKGRTELVHCAPPRKERGFYEVWVFDLQQD